MKNQSKKRVRFITLSAIIAALYVLLTLFSAIFGLSSGAVQIRLSESLCALVAFTPAAVPGLTIGCLISNLLTGANLLDVIFGTLATFLGAIGGRFLRKWDYLVPLPTILANTIIVPLVIVYGFGVTDIGLPLVALGVFSGEIISAGIIGTGLVSILKKYNIRF